jgi:hypothetical protein
LIVVGCATARPLVGHAQQAKRVRRIGVLDLRPRDDPQERSRINAFLQALEPLGWTAGRSLQIDARWASGDVELLRRHATELVAAVEKALGAFAPELNGGLIVTGSVAAGVHSKLIVTLAA